MLMRHCSIALILLLSACTAVPLPSALMDAKMPPQRQLNYTPRVALVLGGGGNRGVAHVGVIKVLQQAGVPIDLLVGTSAGSLVAVMYADNPDIAHVEKMALGLTDKKIIDFSVFRLFNDPVSGKRLQAFVHHALTAQRFSQLKIKTVAVATDEKTKAVFPIASGLIAPAVNASSAVPHVFRPVALYGHILVDGGVSAAVPVAVAKQYEPTLIIAVDVSPNALTGHHFGQLASNRAQQLAWMRQADIMIRPDVGQFKSTDDKHNQALIVAGEHAAQAQLPAIKRLLRSKKIPLKPQFGGWSMG